MRVTGTIDGKIFFARNALTNAINNQEISKTLGSYGYNMEFAGGPLQFTKR